MLVFVCFFFFKQKTAYEISACLVGSEMCIRDRTTGVSSESEVYVSNMPKPMKMMQVMAKATAIPRIRQSHSPAFKERVSDLLRP